MKGNILAFALATLAAAAPLVDEAAKETAAAVILGVRAPEPTPVPRLEGRDIGDTIKSDVGSVITKVESKISGFVESGILNFPNGFPTGTNAEKSLGVSSSDLAAIPTQVLNLPPYGNWTEKGWSLRVHGNVYKVPNVSQSKIDDLANVFLIDTEVKDLDATGQAQARNVTRSIFVVQQGNENVTMSLENNVEHSENTTNGPINAKGGAQTIHLPYNTTAEGDFDAWVQLDNTTGSSGGHLMAGNTTSRIQTLNLYTNGTDSGNATAYLVPPTGLTVVSDIDDILRITKIYQPKEGLLNTFARPFTPWMNMPSIYANWSQSLPTTHFHYLTTTPEQATRNYMEFIFKTYPLGSFDTRPLNFSNAEETLKIRKYMLDRIFQSFPKRKFILVADTSNSDVMTDYPQMYKDYPDQVACILLRNTSSTDSGDKFPYDTSGFKGIPKENYMFFNVPDDLTHLDVASGHCLNATIPQNVTFNKQGLPLGLSGNGSGTSTMHAPWILAVLTTLAMGVFM